MLIGFHPDWQNVWIGFIFMILIGVFFTGLGTAIASLLDDMQAFPLITNFVVMPLFFLSGFLFPLAGLPKIISFIAQIDPLSYGIDGMRGAFTQNIFFGYFADFSVLTISTILILSIRAYFFSKVEI